MVFIGRDDHSSSVHWWIGAQAGPGNPVFVLRDDADNIASIISSSTILSAQWYHIAVTRDHTIGEIKIYINGLNSGTSTTNYTGSFYSSEPATLGLMNYNGNDDYFSDVDLDEVIIHDTVLSQSAIQQHYSDQLEGQTLCPPIVQPQLNDTIKIMPLGNSITFDDYSGDIRPNSERIGYRLYLYNLLNNAGYKFDFIGSEVSGQDLFDDLDNAGFPGVSTNQLATLLQTGYNSRTGIQVTPGPYFDYFQPDVILFHIGTNGVSEDVTALNQVLDIIDSLRVNSGKDIKLLIAKIINRATYDL